MSQNSEQSEQVMMPSTTDIRRALELNTAAILGYADSIRASLLSSVDTAAPPETKQAALRDGIQIGASTLGNISELISDLEANARSLQHGYHQLQSSVHLATNMLSSVIFSLPDEIMVEIMLLCSPSNGLTNITSPARAWFPSVLVMVCRKWKDLVYSSPRLWSSFQVNLDEYWRPLPGGPSNHNDTACMLRMIARHFTRAASAPITLSLSSTSYRNIQDTILRQICMHSDRWEHLTLSRGIPLQILNEDCSHRLSKLRSLNICLSDVTALQPITPFDDAPELRSLTLQDSRSSFLSPNFPWHQLMHLTLYQCDANFAPMLSKTRNLISLSLQPRGYNNNHDQYSMMLPPVFTNYNVHHQEDRSRILQPFIHLRRLFATSESLPIVNCLAAPSLEQLYLRGGALYGAAADMLRRSACDLTELTLVTNWVTNEEAYAIDTLLAACPSLLVLSVQAEYAAIHALYTLLSDTTFVPHLRSLKIVYAGTHAFVLPRLSDLPSASGLSPFQHGASPYPTYASLSPFHFGPAFSPATLAPEPPVLRFSKPASAYIGSMSDPPSIPSASYPFTPFPPAPPHNPPELSFDDTDHVDALAASIQARLTSLKYASISNPITDGIAATLLSFASRGIIVKILTDGLLPSVNQVWTYIRRLMLLTIMVVFSSQEAAVYNNFQQNQQREYGNIVLEF